MTPDTPGGDAHDPHHAALTRLLARPWGSRPDRDEQLFLPLADRPRWKRVRYWLLDHFTGFRYGEDFHALNVVFTRPNQSPTRPASGDCMRQMEAWAFPQVEGFLVEMGEIQTRQVPWHEGQVVVHSAQAHLDYGFGEGDFSAAWGSFAAYSDGCMVFALAVPWRGHKALANAVVERWIAEALPNVDPRTRRLPYRKDD